MNERKNNNKKETYGDDKINYTYLACTNNGVASLLVVLVSFIVVTELIFFNNECAISVGCTPAVQTTNP